MGIQISRREVLNNIIRFKDSLAQHRIERKDRAVRSYPAICNFKTGDLQFQQKASGEMQKGGEWRQVQIEVKHAGGAIRFDLSDTAHRTIDPNGLDPLAYRILNETLEALNQIAGQASQSSQADLTEKEILQDLDQIELTHSSPSLRELPGWFGPIDRYQAERLLENRPVGTYVLREPDEGARAIAHHLSAENGFPVRAFLCTVIESHEKISDILFLQTSRGWSLYLDEPDLSSKIYRYVPHAQGLLLHLRHMAKHPLTSA